MKRKGFVLLITFIIIISGCRIKQENDESNTWSSEISKDVYYTTNGYAYALSESYLMIVNEGFKIINLDTKKVMKEIEIPNTLAGGYDICGTKVVWSTYSSKEEIGKDYGYDETINTDIFLYDIADDSTRQITTDPAVQIAPKVWGDYIIWQDNRNDSVKDMNPEWDIYLYNITTKEEKLITTAPGIHTNPSINDNKVVWEDGRNFSGDPVLRWGSNVPENNTDIYLYDIKTGEEKAIATGPLQECKPSVSSNYIIWEDRNENGFAADIYLYDLTKEETIKITDDKFNQTDPRMFDNYIVWMDERNGISSNDVFVNGKAPNSDIFLYDIEEKKEYLMTGEEPQILPAISKNYIVYMTSRQVNPEIHVIKYK